MEWVVSPSVDHTNCPKAASATLAKVEKGAASALASLAKAEKVEKRAASASALAKVEKEAASALAKAGAKVETNPGKPQA